MLQESTGTSSHQLLERSLLTILAYDNVRYRKLEVRQGTCPMKFYGVLLWLVIEEHQAAVSGGRSSATASA